MTGEAREPRIPVGMDLLLILEKIKDETRVSCPAANLHVDMALDFLDELLDKARAQERAIIAHQLGLVAGEGYMHHRRLLDQCEEILRTAPTSDGVRDGLIDLVGEERTRLAGPGD